VSVSSSRELKLNGEYRVVGRENDVPLDSAPLEFDRLVTRA
jgi:hypothetical protein